MARRPFRRQLEPLGSAGFRWLFLSTLGSSIGTFLAAIALAIDVKDRTNSGLWVGAVLVVEILPTIVVGLTLGPLLDRLQRRRLMVAAEKISVEQINSLVARIEEMFQALPRNVNRQLAMESMLIS